jgi:hypothetical protein
MIMLAQFIRRYTQAKAPVNFRARVALFLILFAVGFLRCNISIQAVEAQVSEASRGTLTVTSAVASPANSRATSLGTPPRSSADNPPATPPAADTIGVIEGDAIAVSGPMSVEVVHGQVQTVLRSGSDVRVKSGTARIALVEGGVINICGPAHLSVLKAAGALTVALESGTIHAHIGRDILLTVYTAQIKAQPIAIGDASQDMLVGFDNPGTMCIRATRGAIRIEQQLTGQSVVIPQTGDVLLVNGQLDSLRTSSGLCKCELQINDAPPEAPAEPPVQISRLATAEDLRKKSFDAKPELPVTPPQDKPALDEGPIYQVVVPPLVYIANAKVQPEIDPAMIILVRRVRVRPTVIFQGRVLDEPVAVASIISPVANAGSVAPGPQATKPAPANTAANPTLADRMRTFMRKIWPPTP